MKDLKIQADNRFEDVFTQTMNDMKEIGTYKPEFSPIITRYTEMRVQFEIIMQQWYDKGCKVMERYTNKAGATNNRKTALYQAVESLRRELTELETLLGLTPAGLSKLSKSAMAPKRQSRLEGVLEHLGGEE